MKKSLFVLLAVIIAFFTSSVYYIFVLKNSQDMLRQKIEAEYTASMNLKATLLENNLSKNIQAAKSLGSRSMIKKRVSEYLDSEISYDEMKDFCEPKYFDGANALSYVICAERYIDSTLLHHYSNCELSDSLQKVPITPPDKIEAEFFQYDTLRCIRVISPVISKETTIVYDVIYFSYNHIFDAIAQNDISIEISTDSKLRDSIGVLRYSEENVSFAIPSEVSNTVYDFSKPQDDMRLDLEQMYSRQLLTSILITAVIILFIFLIRHHIKYSASKTSRELEKIVDQKTSELKSKVEELDLLNRNLQESEEKSRAMFENAGVAALLINPESQRVEDANKAACSYYGYEKEELTKLTLADLNVMTLEEIKKEIQKTRREGNQYFEFQHRLADGRIRDIEVYSSLINIAGKDYLYSVIHDITERKIIEKRNAVLSKDMADLNEELQASNHELEGANDVLYKEREQFLAILDSIPEIIYVADIDEHTILFSNNRMKELLGRDITGEKCYQAIQMQHDVCDFCTNDKIQNTDKPYFWEKYNPLLKKYFYIMDRKIKWTDNKDVRFEMAVDITERKKIENELRKLYTAVEQSPATIIITDLDACIEYANPIITRQTGYTLEEIKGKNPRIFNSGKTPKETFTELWETLTKGNIWTGRFINRTKSGSVYHEQATIAPITGSDGSTTHYIGIKKDITEQVKFQNKLLENEQKLKETVDSLAEANNAKDKFFNIIAHDLINPFNSILGFSQLLVLKIEKLEREDIHRIIKKIHETGKSTFSLLENLLEWARTQAGKIKFRPENIDTESLFQDLENILRSIAEAKEIDLTFSANDIDAVFADKNMLKTVLRNLTGNALKFTRPGGKTEVRLSEKSDRYIFSVIDNGVGISADRIANLFKAEEKISSLGTDNEKGTGLGLLICNEFVERHGGKIEIESELGKGSTFSFDIPKQIDQ